MTKSAKTASRPRVPPQALLLSLLSLWVPVLTSSLFPDWTNSDVGILIWLLALIPPFLLSYYRGWKGASLALAAGMAAFAVAQVVVTVIGARIPGPDIMLGILVVLIGVSMGSGVLSSLFHRSLNRAEEMALTDPGTGLPNRRHGMLHLTRAFAAAARGSELSVVMYDLDKFKQVNDRFGHQKGDEVLRHFADILKSHTRTENLSVRFGGEEFMTILDGHGAEGAAIMANRILADLREHEWPWGNVTVSAGISEFEDGMASPDVLVAAADQALYRAKAQGGDLVVTLARQGEDTDAVVPSPAELEGDHSGNGELVLVVDDDPAVLRTLSRGLLRHHYQPIEASDPTKAVQIVRGLDEPVDLVITDLVMPGISGFRMVEMLMEVQPDLRALYISGYSSDEVRWSGVPGGVKSFLPKPISLDALTAAVRGILDAPLPDRPGEAPAAPALAAAAGPAVLGAGAEDRVEGSETNGSLVDRLEASTARLEEAYGELLLRLAWAAEYRDDVTGHHAERVGRLCGMLAREMGLSEEDTGRIEMAAPLHDLGKIAVPDAVLRKPDPLTPTERELMARHCQVGADLLAGSRHPLVQEAERIARFHHERWDGDGYPDGLAGEEIPVSARITAVADAYDSLTDTRPYRPAVSREEALEVIVEDRGGHFDPDIVDALLRIDEAGALERLKRGAVAGEWHGDATRSDSLATAP